jgi:Family of unknown function (DUF5302)
MAEKTAGSPEKSEDETQRKFREALERKNAMAKKAHGEDHLGNQGVGLSHNDKSKRQFRRKSGG